MDIRKFFAATFLVAVLLVSGAANSATISYKPIDVTQFVLGSNLGVGEQQAADKFTVLSSSTLIAMDWYGGIFNGLDVNGGLRDFTVRLYTDDSGLPSNTPFFEQSVTASIAYSGLTNLHSNSSSMPIYQYTSSLNQVDLIAGNEYWVSILNEDPVSFGDQWVWQASSYDPDNYLALRDGANPDSATWTMSTDSARNSMAFLLQGSAVVPIPPALYLFGSGLIGLIGIAKRKRTAS